MSAGGCVARLLWDCTDPLVTGPGKGSLCTHKFLTDLPLQK